MHEAPSTSAEGKVFQWLHSIYQPDTESMLPYTAAVSGSMETCVWLSYFLQLDSNQNLLWHFLKLLMGDKSHEVDDFYPFHAI